MGTPPKVEPEFPEQLKAKGAKANAVAPAAVVRIKFLREREVFFCVMVTDLSLPKSS
jgi:hypothetical protein